MIRSDHKGEIIGGNDRVVEVILDRDGKLDPGVCVGEVGNPARDVMIDDGLAGGRPNNMMSRIFVEGDSGCPAVRDGLNDRALGIVVLPR